MKKNITKAGLCALAAGLLISSTVYAAEIPQDTDSAVISGIAWRKKDKEAKPEAQPESANPETTPTQAAPGVNPAQPAPKAAPKEAPATENAPKESSYRDINENVEGSFVRSQSPRSNRSQQNQTGDYQRNSGNMPTNNAIDNTQNNQNYQNNQNHQNNQNFQNNQNNQSNQNTHPSDYSHGITKEIHKILANQSAIQLDPNAYIVQHEDGLWLVMGNIRAKVDILIYVDQKNMQEAEHPNLDGGSAIPLFK